LLGSIIDMAEVESVLLRAFADVFAFELTEIDRDELQALLLVPNRTCSEFVIRKGLYSHG
jgi:hypothetical protein